MQPLKALLMDLDDTVYLARQAYLAGDTAAQRRGAGIVPAWADAEVFRREFDEARRSVTVVCQETAAWHSRFLYFKTMLERRTGRSDLRSAMAISEAYWEGYLAECAPDEGCPETLAWLREQGVRLAWVTNFTSEPQVRKLETLGLAEAADFFLASEEVGVEKPDPRIMQIACERFGVAPKEAWMIGDSLEHDMPAARALGLTTLWFRRPRHAHLSPNGNVDHLVEDWGQARSLFENALSATQ